MNNALKNVQKRKSRAHRAIRARESDVLSSSDIREPSRTSRVNERVQESEHGFPGGDELVVDERDDAREGRGRSRGATYETGSAANDDFEVPALGRNLHTLKEFNHVYGREELWLLTSG